MHISLEYIFLNFKLKKKILAWNWISIKKLKNYNLAHNLLPPHPALFRLFWYFCLIPPEAQIINNFLAAYKKETRLKTSSKYFILCLPCGGTGTAYGFMRHTTSEVENLDGKCQGFIQQSFKNWAIDDWDSLQSAQPFACRPVQLSGATVERFQGQQRNFEGNFAESFSVFLCAYFWNSTRQNRNNTRTF